MIHTEIKTIELEQKGKRAFQNDESDVDRELEADMDYPKRFNERYPQLADKVETLKTSLSEDLQLEGGGRSNKGKSQKGTQGRGK